MSFRKIKEIMFGGSAPDLSDPAVAARRDRTLNAGRRFGRFTRLDGLFAAMQRFAGRKPVLFLVISFGTVLFFFTLNIVSLVQRAGDRPRHTATAVEMQDSLLQNVIIKNREEYATD